MQLKIQLTIGVLLLSLTSFAQEMSPVKQFWTALQSHCGLAYEGTLVLPEEDEDFGDKRLVMHLRSCTEAEIKIPFYVGDDKSRTWIFTYKNDRITLKHDHRHKDGTEDEVNFYGGTTTNVGRSDIQFFPADDHTQAIIPAAATNVWWVTINDTTFTYNLKRLGTDRIFKVDMDLSTTVATPDAPWGWKE